MRRTVSLVTSGSRPTRIAVALRPGWVAASLFVAAASGCNQKDAQKCEEAQGVIRQAIAKEDFAAATNWRQYAWQNCEDTSVLGNLDQEIVTQRGAVVARKRAAAARRAETVELLKLFLGWVAQNRRAPQNASAEPVCDGSDDEAAPAVPGKKPSEERLCTATRQAGSHEFSVRYWEAEPEAARFTVKIPDLTSCAELGAKNPIRTWPVAATEGRTTQRSRCEFTTGALAGLHAVLSQAQNSELYVFSPAYLDRDPTYKVILTGP